MERKELIDFDEWQKINCPPHKMYTSQQKVDLYLKSINSHHDKGGTLGNNEQKEKSCRKQTKCIWTVTPGDLNCMGCVCWK